MLELHTLGPTQSLSAHTELNECLVYIFKARSYAPRDFIMYVNMQYLRVESTPKRSSSLFSFAICIFIVLKDLFSMYFYAKKITMGGSRVDLNISASHTKKQGNAQSKLSLNFLTYPLLLRYCRSLQLLSDCTEHTQEVKEERAASGCHFLCLCWFCGA